MGRAKKQTPEQLKERKQRFQQLLNWARIVNGNCSGRELGQMLDHDSGHLPDLGEDPKLDMIMRLADLLAWPVECVIQYWANGSDGLNHEGPGPNGEVQKTDCDQIIQAANKAYEEGEYRRTIALAQRAQPLASTARSFARACNFEGIGWGGLGRYAKGLEAWNRGLHCVGIPPPVRRMLEVNAANAYYVLGELAQARGMAQSLIDWYTENPAAERMDVGTEAFAHSVFGHALRRMIHVDPDTRLAHASKAKANLETSCRLWTRLPGDPAQEYWGGIANTCRGGIIEVEVVLGTRDAQSAIDELWKGLSPVLEPEEWPVGNWLESYGWWCVFGCRVAVRHLSEVEMQQPMAQFTIKGYEIADRLNDWALRERIFTLEHMGRMALAGCTGTRLPWPLDNEEKQLVIGTMGRFPGFFRTGRMILNATP